MEKVQWNLIKKKKYSNNRKVKNQPSPIVFIIIIISVFIIFEREAFYTDIIIRIHKSIIHNGVKLKWNSSRGPTYLPEAVDEFPN